MGASDAGKSTTASTLRARGFTFLADDASRVDGAAYGRGLRCWGRRASVDAVPDLDLQDRKAVEVAAEHL
jgi:hypothetical protein